MTRALVLAVLLGTSALAASPALAQGPGFEIVSTGPALELRFRGLQLRSVHADDNQNALALSFQQPVDGALFDQLNRALPGWVAMAYANYDNGVIRATRPVTFLTRNETDGFSLRLQPRGDAPAAGGPPANLRGGYAGEGPPPYPAPYPPPSGPYPGGQPPMGAPLPGPGPVGDYQRYDRNSAARAFYQLQMALHRGDPSWTRLYDKSAMQSDSSFGIGTEWHEMAGDRVLNTHAKARVAIGNGIALIGQMDYALVRANNIRAPNGTIAAALDTGRISGAGGLAFSLWDEDEVTLQALAGNGVVGVGASALSSTAEGAFLLDMQYHAPYTDTPEAISLKGRKDVVSVLATRQLGYGFWGALGGMFNRYGVSGRPNVAQTYGWKAALHWNNAFTDFGGVVLGLGYDGVGEYIDTQLTLGTGTSAYNPLSIRKRELHAGRASLGAEIYPGLHLSGYVGYAEDRFGSGGMFEGLMLRAIPAPGLDIALGVRRSNVSFTQGVVGKETSAGLTVNLGFGGPPGSSTLFY